MSGRNNQRKSAVVKAERAAGKEQEVETDFTDRVLLSLVFDVTCLAENVERVKVQVTAMAKERGLPVPETDHDD